jgi:hypothetical protein
MAHESNSEEDEIILDDVIENEQLGMKKEFNVFVRRDLVNHIELLKKNYIESQDLIKVEMPLYVDASLRRQRYSSP